MWCTKATVPKLYYQLLPSDEALLSPSRKKILMHECTKYVCMCGVTTSLSLETSRATTSWIIPRLLPSTDIDLRSVSMASWLVIPLSGSPLTAISWSFTQRRPSCAHINEGKTLDTLVMCMWMTFRYILSSLDWEEKQQRHWLWIAFKWQSNVELLALLAAPPLMMDLTKMPKSVLFSLDRFPLTLTPRPAEPESFSGISKVMNSCAKSDVNTMSSSSDR